MKRFSLFLTVLLSIPTTSLLANAFWSADEWHGVWGVESGITITTNAGKSQTFPIDSPTGEFYQYSVTSDTQTKATYGAFIGIERY
ncbi:MAG: hypothetical protein Q8K75_00680 [Chlamydiales bacterium]|nr:hypothetical protein [Chlamydiales bacterium]